MTTSRIAGRQSQDGTAIDLLPLPTGWKWMKVGDVGEVKLGRQRSPEHHDGKHMRPYLRVANVYEDRIDLDDVMQMNFTPAEFETFRLRHGDILLNEGQSLEWVGRPAMFRDEVPGACFQNTLIRFRSHAFIDSSFALFVFRYYLHNRRFQKIAKWTTNIAHLGAQRLAEIEFPVPPLEEQRRIVAKIDELFSDLDAGVAALERVRANLKRYRAAVLKAAVEGSFGGNGSPHAPPPWKPIGEVIHDLEQGWSPKCESVPAMDDGEWAVMTTTAIQPLRFSSDENKRLPKGLAPRADLEVRVGDMVITRAGPRTRAGVACLVRSTRKRLILCDKAYRFQCDEKQIRGAFLEIALNAPPVLKSLEKMKTGISDSGVNLTQPRFRELLVPVPSLPAQARIVAEVDRRISVADAAETQVEHALQRVARLRQSILKRAFEGRLVDQDPSGEPVAMHFERIRTGGTVAGRARGPGGPL